MQPTILGIDPKWNSLLPLVLINGIMLSTVILFALTYKKRPRDMALAGRAHSRWLGPFFFEYWGWLIAPIENFFIRCKISPNVITTLGFVLGFFSGLAFATGHFGIAGWLMILGGTFDMFDGSIARRMGLVSPAGAFYDAVMDRFAECAVFFGLAIFYRESWVLYAVYLGLIGSMMVSYTRAKGDSVGVDCKVGFMQRPERIVYLGVASIFSPPLRQLIQRPGAAPVEYLTIIALVLIAVMTFITAIYRMAYILRKLNVLAGQKPKVSSSPFLQKLIRRYLDI